MKSANLGLATLTATATIALVLLAAGSPAVNAADQPPATNSEIKIDDEEFLILKEDEILAKLSGAAKAAGKK